MVGLGDVDLHLVSSIDEAVQFKVWLGRQRDVLAIDTETSGLSWFDERLRLVQFGDHDAGWAIPWDRWGGVALEALERYDGQITMHNARFDTHFLEHHGKIKLDHGRIDDTRVMAHILDPDGPTGLKPLAARLVDQRAANASYVLDEAMQLQKWTWATVPIDFEPYWMYGALDCVLTAHLWEQLAPQVMRYHEAYELEMAVAWVVLNMETRGFRIDVPYTEARYREFMAYVDQVKTWGQEAYGINLGSTKQVTQRLLEDGVVLEKTTPKGAYALDEEVLLDLRDAHPLAMTVLGMRKMQKLATTYLENFLELHRDGVVRARVNTLGARTARMSVDTPALQTLPRDAVANPAAITVRNCFVASPGHRLVLCDFQQIEQRLMAHFSHDPGMIAAFASGDDVFTVMAQRIFNDPTITKKDERRQHCKNAAYAKAYGAGVAQFARTAGVGLEAGKLFLEAYDREFPGVRSFQMQVERVARERLATEGEAYVTTPTGRRQPADDGRLYTLVNYLIQCTAAEVLKRKIVDLDLAGLGEYLVLPVHDEVILDVPNEYVNDAARLVVDTMTDRTSFDLPLTVDLDVVDRWGDKYLK